MAAIELRLSPYLDNRRKRKIFPGRAFFGTFRNPDPHGSVPLRTPVLRALGHGFRAGLGSPGQARVQGRVRVTRQAGLPKGSNIKCRPRHTEPRVGSGSPGDLRAGPGRPTGPEAWDRTLFRRVWEGSSGPGCGSPGKVRGLGGYAPLGVSCVGKGSK